MPITNEPTSIIVTELNNKVVISETGLQGPRGKTILNGEGPPPDSIGIEGDFYYDKLTTRLYGPKLAINSWANSINFLLNAALTYPFSIHQVQNAGSYYYLEIVHDFGYNPNVTVKNSAGDILETGIDYNSTNKITLTMAQPFGGTAYLS